MQGLSSIRSSLVVLCSAVVALVACSSDVAPISPQPTTPAPSDSVKRAVVDSIRVLLLDNGVYVGDTTRFTATAYDSAAHVIPDAVITWTSSDTSIATVDGTGLVTGRQRGGVDITASSGGVSRKAALAVSPILSITPGDSISFTSYYRLPTKVRLSLQAGDTVDLGGWVRGSEFTFPSIEWDDAATTSKLEAIASYADDRGARGVIVPGLVAKVAGSYLFRVRTGVGVGPCNILGITACTVPTTVQTRRSKPSIPAVGYTSRGTAGTILNDSLVLRNAGAGDVSISITHAPAWLTVSPSAATIHGRQSQRFALRAEAAPEGIRTDSIVFSGIPADGWSPAWRAASVTVRLDGPDIILSTPIDLVSVGLSPANALVGAGWKPGSVYTIDPSSGQTQLLATGLDQAASTISQITAGGDGTLYVSQGMLRPGTNLPRTLLSREVNGALEPFVTLDADLLAMTVTPERVLFYSTGPYQPDTIFWRSLVDSTQNGTIAVGATPRPYRVLVVDGIVPNPVDHKLYYSVLGMAATTASPGELHVVDPKTKTSVTLGPIVGRVAAIDKRGYIYTISNGEIINKVTTISVYDATGKLLDTRWPSLDVSSLAVDDNWIYGIDSNKKRSIVKMPVRIY